MNSMFSALNFFSKIKNISFIFLALFFLVFSNGVDASGIKIEDVFSDINKGYKYYNELQTLYDRGMIFPDTNGRFNAKRLLNRDEFVGISMEVTCKRCISPNTDFSFIRNYSNTETFYDVEKNNKYFYCIAESDKKGYVKGYDSGYTCENAIGADGERPFCIDNKITLEEALAVVLRNSGIFTIEDNKQVIQKIYSGEISGSLSDDVHTKNSDGSPYTFYGYFQKALDFELLEYDTNGNEKVYKLLELRDDKIRPEQNISKEDFLRIAYVALKANSCVQTEKNDLALNIEILNKVCVESEECDNKNIGEDEKTFDFRGNVFGICEKGINNTKSFTWKFYNISTGEEVIKYGKYIDNYTFLELGKWRIFLNVEDNCGNTGQVYSTINIGGEKDPGNTENERLAVKIDATPLYGTGILDVDFKAIVEGGNGDYTYSWDYGDGTTGNVSTTNHRYTIGGSYPVILTVEDGDGKQATSTVTIVLDNSGGDIYNTNNGLGVQIKANPLVGIAELEVDFDAIAKGGNGKYDYVWDYGDGSTGSGANVNHIYVSPGTYLVTLRVKDGDGKEGESTVTIVVDDNSGSSEEKGLGVQIVATPLFGVTELDVDFDAIVEGGDGDYIYEWDYGNGTTGSGANVNYIYTEIGIYNITLSVKDGDGNKGEGSVMIVVTDSGEGNGLGVQINATPISGEVDLDVSFEALAKGGNGNYTYIWDFGDGHTGEGKNSTHIYTKAGEYQVELQVTDSDGKQGKGHIFIVSTGNIVGNNGIDAQITAVPIFGNAKMNVVFDAIVSPSEGDYTYSWSFGDSSGGYGKSIQHTFIEEGEYSVYLTVEDKEGNLGEASVLIKALDGQSCDIDQDNDGVVDCDDKCPVISGSDLNEGCPILESACDSSCGCQEGYICTSSTVETCGDKGVCIPKREVLNPCLESGQSSLIYGNATCNSCPCDNAVDFKSSIRKCDLIFPAITSPDSTEIYSRGAVYRVK